MKPLKEYSRDELIASITFYQEREKYFARLLDVPDAGQFRADWDAAVLKVIKDRDSFREQVENSDESSAMIRRKIATNEALKSLLIRARPFTEGSPLYKEIIRFLSNEPAPEPFHEALEIALIHLMVWCHRYPDDVDESDKIDLNWILSILGRPKRYQGVPDKDLGGS